MANRDRPGREIKKKPKEKGARPNLQGLQSLGDVPQNVELIKKARKPRSSEDQDQG